jgi:phospho-N-acetylmuramoyl-pentapeptide-transferase
MIIALVGCLAFAIAALCGTPLIARLRAMSLKQTAYEDAPKTHQVKTGTPTMGGLLFIAAPIVALIFAPSWTTLALTVLTIGCGGVGMIDDVAAIQRQRNRGLTARVKFAATIAVAVVFLAIAAYGHILNTNGFTVPAISAPMWLVVGLALFAVVGTTHAVNLTDGLDGLAGGSILPPLAVVAWIAARTGAPEIALFDVALIGAVCGFLLYNRHPAKVFMGDTGALALGGALAGSAILCGATLVLPLIGAVFVAEALSVILQVASFKTTGRRIFRMSPLHHHFELGGVSEVRVTQGFWAVSAACALVAVAVWIR